MKTLGILLTVTSFSVLTSNVSAQEYHSDNLIPVADLGKYQAIGVSVSSGNRLFVSFPNRGGAYQYGLTENVNGKRIPYPDEAWNKPGDGASHFVSVQDLFVDASDFLWVLDSKPAPGGSIFGNAETAVKGQFKLLKINTQTNRVEKVYTFDDLDKAHSGLNDIRVDTEKQLAYLSDPGLAAIVVLDLKKIGRAHV